MHVPVPAIAARFWRVAKPFFVGENRWRALGLLGALLALLLAINGLNVAISFIGRNFMTAVADRHAHDIYVYAGYYLGVFAASAAVGALARYAELLLGLRWRDWLTRFFLTRYLGARTYHRLNAVADVDNPDERISEDIRTFTTTSLSFLVMGTNSLVTIIAFAGVLWSITPWLLAAGVLYPLIGTGLIVWVGRRLVQLNHLQLKKEADFRFGLVHVRAQAEAIALDQAEQKEEPRLQQRLAALIDNYGSIIKVLRNLEFVRGGYNYLDQLIPVLIVAPLYLRGDVEFGVVTQAAMGFSQIFNAFSLIAEKYQDLAAFAAVIGRVGTLQEAIAPPTTPAEHGVEVVEADAPLAYQQLTLKEPRDDHVLVHDVSLEVPRGQRVLVTGPNRAGQRALFRATAGLWDRGTGRIVHPSPRCVLFLPEQPYLVPGSLRDQFRTVVRSGDLADGPIRGVLRAVGLDYLAEVDLDAERDWAKVLPLADKQRLAIARLLLVKPDFAFLDHATSALRDDEAKQLYEVLKRSPVTYVSVGDLQPGLRANHDVQLELRPDGTWAVNRIEVAHG